MSNLLNAFIALINASIALKTRGVLLEQTRRKDKGGEFLPVTRADIEAREWDALDFLFITGDAYVDHPSFAMALIGRLLERRGYRVGIAAPPDWRRAKKPAERTPTLQAGGRGCVLTAPPSFTVRKLGGGQRR